MTKAVSMVPMSVMTMVMEPGTRYQRLFAAGLNQ